MDWLFRGSSRYANPYQKYDNGQCMNSYSTLKDDIYQRIDHFYNARHENIYKEWNELYRYIKEKNASIKHCVENRYINSDFSKDEKINNFKSICNKRGRCHINVESNINTNPPSKRTGTVERCRERKNCKTEKAGKVKLQPQLEGEPSKATLLQRPKAQETSQEHAGGKESNKQREDLPAQSDLNTLLNSIKSKDDESVSVTNKQSSTSVQGSTSPQALTEIGGTPARELNPQAKDSPSKSISDRESDARGTLQVSYSGISLFQGNLSDNQTLDTNHHNMQTHQGGGVENQDNHEKLVTELSDRVSLPGSHSAPEKLDNEGSVDSNNNGPGNNVEAHVLEDTTPLDTKNEGVISASTKGVSSGDASPSPKTYGDGVPGAVNGKEIQNGQERDSEHICNEISSSAEKDGELTDAKLDILAQISNVIKSNPQIIKTSMPIGIALLLGLLFKFTPLWRVLTKKNRKKGVGINEELNSVLQEPSIMDEETSIPFSYGAFEYSPFDQNSY
ncbi:hypothetical protein PVNG_06214 [Plasmodium vivax North Korean]|uniref:Variable surface protein Vir18 n=1 Tax=Plasmodium vivax North Korean TaxID=1035514 RepID=A0A0J9U3K3_PLAVI|nr:hypothetical protein PVNG_06214 [Plasmodium vivax North Korean]